MTAETIIYAAVALSASLSVGVLGAFFWSERRWRERERDLSNFRKLAMVERGASSNQVDVDQRLVPIQRRPFHEALQEDEPDLAPSPQARAVIRELAARRRNNETETNEMKLTHLAAAASLGLAACTHPPTGAAPMQRNVVMAQPDYVAPRPEVTWSFDGHSFGAYCYNTIGCKVLYANHYQVRHEIDEVAPPPERAGVQKYWGGAHVGIDNFPPPAVVTWRSLDGVAHEVRIDIGEIFKDQQVLHNVPAEKLAWNATRTGMNPSIILVVDDRTISVYMKAFVVLKEPRTPGNPHSDYQSEAVLAWRHIY